MEPFNACVSAGRKQFARHEWAQKAAYLLGCTLEELSSSVFKNQARSGTCRQTSEENCSADAGSQKTKKLKHIYTQLHTSTHNVFPCLFCLALNIPNFPDY